MACSSSTTVESECTPGEERTCLCDDGTASTQVCAENGQQFEACQCDGAVADGGNTDAGGEATLSCDSYCDLLEQNCTGEQLQYPSRSSCLTSCAALPEGTLDDSAGNTLGCRITHAQFAAENARVHCPHAGPAGTGTCGSNCDSYCALMFGMCPGEYPDTGTCLETCLTFEGAASTEYQVGASGDNAQCRIYHSTLAAEGDTQLHCSHARADSTEFCIP